MGETIKYRKLNKSKLSSRKRSSISSEESLKNIEPIKWSKEVLQADKPISLIKSTE